MKDITLLGVNMDEAHIACGTVNLLLKKDTLYSAVNIIFLGRRFPLMIADYLPALQAYLLLPFFILFGINVFSLRMAPISFGLLTLVFTYLFAKEFFSRKIAFITLLLLVTSPYFIFATKLGNFFHSYWLFFSTSALFCFFKWHRKGSIVYFLLGTFLLGLGSSLVGWFVVFVIGILALAFIFLKDIKKRIAHNRPFWAYFILGAVSFCIGDFLFLYANFINKSSRLITFKCILSNFRYTCTAGMDNLNYIKNFSVRIAHLLELLTEIDIVTVTLRRIDGNTFFPFLFFSLLLWLVFSLVFRKNMYFNKKKVAFIIVLMCIMFIVSPFTVAGLSSWHLLILVPFIQIVVSVGLVEFAKLFKNRILGMVSWGIVFLSLLISLSLNFKIIRYCYAEMTKTGGGPFWSNTIYELSNWLREHRCPKIIALSWGVAENSYFLMQGKKYVFDYTWAFGKENEEGFIKRYIDLFKDKDTLYIINTRGSFDGKDRNELFKKAVNIAGKKLIQEKIFFMKNGEPIYLVYSVS